MREPHRRELFFGSKCGKKFSGLDDLKKHERTPQQRKGIQLPNANVRNVFCAQSVARGSHGEMT